MPQVKFLQDFQGAETKEAFYKAGQVADLPENMTDRLIKDKRAELVKPIVPDVVLASEPQFENAYPELEEPAPKHKRGRK